MELKPATWASRVSGSRLGVQLDAKNAMEMVDAPATAQCTASVPVAAQVTASTRRTTPQASLACCSAPPLGALSVVLDPSHCVHLAIRPFILCLLAAEHRSANRAAAAGSKADWTKFNPWVSGGEAPHSLLPLSSPLARLPLFSLCSSLPRSFSTSYHLMLAGIAAHPFAAVVGYGVGVGYGDGGMRSEHQGAHRVLGLVVRTCSSMHDSDIHTVLMRALWMIFRRRACAQRVAVR